MNWLWVHLLNGLGVRPRTPSTAYNWWSGAGSDVGELAILGALITGYRHVNCHTKGCFRIGHHPVEGTTYKTCRRHHPVFKDHPKRPSLAHIHALHAAHIKGLTARSTKGDPQ